MVERDIRLSPVEYFSAREPAPRVRDFIEQTHNPTFSARLAFLRKEFPQRSGRKINWILEGGTAVALYCPHLKRPIRDLDIITLTPSIANEFVNTFPHFHARSIEYWLDKRGFKSTMKNINYVMHGSCRLHIDGAELLTLAPAMLAASKVHLYDKLPPRPQDLEDVRNLGISKDKYFGVIDRLLAA